MTSRAFALLGMAALLLGGCHQRKEGASALDAGADARARTAAKTLADLQAAEQASGGPLPQAPAERARAAVSVPDRSRDETPAAEDVPDAGANRATSDN